MSRTRRQSAASVQERLIAPREILAGNIVSLASARSPVGREFHAVLRVDGLNFALKSEEEQERILLTFRALVQHLAYDLQIYIRAVPLDLSPYTAHFGSLPGGEDDSAPSAEILALRDAHLEHLKTLARERVLIDHQCYVVVPAEVEPKSTALPRHWPFARHQARRKTFADAYERAREQLLLRVREVSRLCATMGLHARRLEGPALLDFYYRAVMFQRPAVPESILKEASRLDMEPARVQAPPQTDNAAPPPRRRRKARRREGTLPSPASLQIADLLAPAGMIHGEMDLTLIHQEREYVRTLVVQELSRDVPDGWLRPLLELDELFVEVSLHLHPRSLQSALRHLRTKQTTHQASRQVAAQRGMLLDAQMQVSEHDVDALILKVASGEERLADISLVVLVRAHSEAVLEQRTRRVLSVLNTLVVARPAYFLQEEGFLTALPYGRDLLARWGSSLLLDSTSIATCFPFLSSALFMPDGVFFGVTQSGEPIVIDRWDASFQNANCLVDGPSGYGKSFLIKTVLTRLALQATRRQLIVTDPDREYKRACLRFGGQWIRLAAGSGYRINPLDLFYTRRETPAPYSEEDDEVFLEEGDRLAEKVATVRELFQIMLARRGSEGVLPLLPEEIGYLEHCLYEAYRRVGITSKSTTHGRPAPLLRDVYEVIEKAIFGPDRFGLLERLYPYVHGSYASFFDGPTNVQLDRSFLVFDTRDLDTRLAPTVLAVLSEFVWTQTFESDMPREFVIDEAGVLAEYEAWARFMAHIVARARKHWLAVTLILQNVESFQQSRYARIILDNCDTKILLGRARTTTLRETYDLSEHEEDLLKSFGRGEGIIITPTKRVAARFEANPLEYEVATTKPSDLAVIRRREQASSAPAALLASNGVHPVDDPQGNSQQEEQPR